MGKIRKFRKKYHVSLKKSKSLNNLSEAGDLQKPDESKDNSLMTSDENIFAGIDISWDDFNKTLPKDFDLHSHVSTKSRKELKEEERHMKKKEKKKLRHERFLQKLCVTHQDKSKKKKFPKNKFAGSDMSSLLNALPSVQSLSTKGIPNTNHENPKTKVKGILKSKHRLKQQAIDVKIFKHILDDKIFRKNPLEAISQHLKQKIAMET